MKKLLGIAVLLSAVATPSFAASHDSQVLRSGVNRVKSQIDRVISQMGGAQSLNEADFELLRFLLTSSDRLEQGTDSLDLSDSALAAGDTDGYLNNFALACNKVAAARAQLGNASRRARTIGSAFPTSVFLDEQKTDITDTRDSANCPH